MPKKPSLTQHNASLLNDLINQPVSGSSGFITEDFKRFIAEEMIEAANAKKIRLSPEESLQDRYNKFKLYYDKLFTSGMQGHGMFIGSVLKKFEYGEYYINEKGVEKRVSYAELAYKMELFAHKLSTEHDVAFTKFKPTYFVLGKGKYKIVINIPDMRKVDLDEMTVEEIVDYLDEEGVEIIISDPKKIKNKEDRKKRDKSKKDRQIKLRKSKEKHYRQWKKKEKK